MMMFIYLELVYINVVKMGLGIDPVAPIGPANLGWKYTKAIVIKSQILRCQTCQFDIPKL